MGSDGPLVTPAQAADCSGDECTNPGGYWYRIASSPWNGNFYAVANTFWNGDVAGQPPYTHDVDLAVPDC